MQHADRNQCALGISDLSMGCAMVDFKLHAGVRETNVGVHEGHPQLSR